MTEPTPKPTDALAQVLREFADLHAACGEHDEEGYVHLDASMLEATLDRAEDLLRAAREGWK